MGLVCLYRRSNTLIFYLSLVTCFFILTFMLSYSNAKRTAAKISSAVSASNSLHSRSTSSQTRNIKINFKRTPPSILHYQMNNVTTSSDPARNRETVLILTPLARFYQEYWDNLIGLSYPRELITLGFIVPKNRQGNLAMTALKEQIIKTQKYGPTKDKFRSIIIERQEFDTPLAFQSESENYTPERQKARRAAMSKARNSLLFTTLNPAISWVLWLDADIIETPPTLIQDLASHNKPIIAPNCFQKYPNPKTKKISERPFDFNSWQDTEASQKLAENLGPDDVILEGYTDMSTHRTLMAYMTPDNGDPKSEVGLDGVGGKTLLVKAEVHRDGAMFPPFPFYHLIESEGFVKMAKRLGWNTTGLPNYKVYHHHE